MKYLITLLLIVTPAIAENPHHGHTTVESTTIEPVIIYIEQPSSSPTASTTSTVDTLENTVSYEIDKCYGAAIAQAGANNHMNIGTQKLQLSLGIGECDSELASSLMMGTRLNKNLLLSGSWATDKDINAFGIGFHMVFK